MKISILMENTPFSEGFLSEHGLSIHIETEQHRMLASYESEQSDLKTRAVELDRMIGEATEQTENIESFLRLVRSYTEITELSAEVVHEFIEKVLVGETIYTPPKYSHWGRGKTQEVRIVYNYLGEISETINEA